MNKIEFFKNIQEEYWLPEYWSPTKFYLDLYSNGEKLFITYVRTYYKLYNLLYIIIRIPVICLKKTGL